MKIAPSFLRLLLVEYLAALRTVTARFHHMFCLSRRRVISHGPEPLNSWANINLLSELVISPHSDRKVTQGEIFMLKYMIAMTYMYF